MNVNALPSHNETAVGGREEAGNSVVVVVVVAAGRGQRTEDSCRQGWNRTTRSNNFNVVVYIHTYMVDGWAR